MGEEKITVEKIKRYVELDNEIQMLEIKNIRKNMKQKENHLKDVEETQTQLKADYKKSQEKTKKEKADVDELSGKEGKIEAEIGKTKFNEKMSKEQAEYLEALNEEELVKQQLEGISKQIEEIKLDIEKKKPDIEQLDKVTAEQEQLLTEIFGGSYGSTRENELESKLDMLVEKTGRIKVAKSKWQNGKTLLQYAVNQLAYGVDVWKQMEKINRSDTQEMYRKATDARNNFEASKSNINNTQNYLKNIKFPYCKPDEMETLHKAITNVYIDMMTQERHKHACECFTITHKRAYALLQWFENVCNSVIDKDYKEALQEERECSRQLRDERLKLMKEIVEKQGGTCNLDQMRQDFKDDDLEDELTGLTDADDVPGVEGTSKDMPPPTPMPLKNLAAVPDKEMLFDNIDQLKNEYTRQKTEFEKVQEMNKNRIDQGLEEKRAARRMRRKRMDAS